MRWRESKLQSRHSVQGSSPKGAQSIAQQCVARDTESMVGLGTRGTLDSVSRTTHCWRDALRPRPLWALVLGRNDGKVVVRVVLALLLSTTPALAVEPDEILKDPALEARARDISSGLRCLVCQNQSIDDSNASVARDLRILIREQLQSGKSDAEAVDFVVARYGDFVLLKPRFTLQTLILWLGPFAILLAAGLMLLRRRQPPSQNIDLTAAEKAEIERLLRE